MEKEKAIDTIDFSYYDNNENDYEDFIEVLDEYIEMVEGYTGYWRAEGRNIGWQNREGFLVYEADNGEDLILRIIPKSDCRLSVKSFRDRIEVSVFHHDSPTGEFYTITPESEKVFRRYC